MIRKMLWVTLACASLMGGPARATDTIVWWDFLSGGDGVRMKAMLDEFNKEHAGKVQIEATTLEWGVPYYSKVQTSTAIGQGPDVMTYHESRFPLGISQDVLSPISPDELAAAGIKASDFGEANWKAAQSADGKQYGVPLDIHASILYYNKDLLKAAGLLGDDGKPKGLDGVANWDAALAKLTTKDMAALSVPNDAATGWRVFYTLLNQQGGCSSRTASSSTATTSPRRKPRSAKCRSGSRTAGPRRTPNTQRRLPCSPPARWRCTSTATGRFRPWSTSPRRGNSSTGARSRSRSSMRSRPPGRIRTPSPFPIVRAIRSIAAKRKLVLDAIHWFNVHSLEWAGGGHTPSYLPVQESDAFKALKPNSDYVSLAKTAAFDPVSTLAGVASPVYDASGNYIIPGMMGEMTPTDAATKMRDDLQSAAK